MDVVVTTGAIRHAKLQPNCHHRQNKHPVLYRPDALPVAQPTVSEHWKEEYILLPAVFCDISGLGGGMRSNKWIYIIHITSKQSLHKDRHLLVQFRIGVDFLPHGCCIFHLELRLVGWRRRIQRLQKDWISDGQCMFLQCILHLLSTYNQQHGPQTHSHTVTISSVTPNNLNSGWHY